VVSQAKKRSGTANCRNILTTTAHGGHSALASCQVVSQAKKRSATALAT